MIATTQKSAAHPVRRKASPVQKRGILVRHDTPGPDGNETTQNLGDADGVPGFEDGNDSDTDLASVKKNAMRGLFRSQRGGY